MAKPIERLLFTTKFREPAFDSLKALLPLREAGLVEMVLCHVIPREEVGFTPFGGYLKEEEERLREEARIRFEDWQRVIQASGIRSRVVIEVGEPVPKLLSIAAREKVDLIVAGKKKYSRLESLFMGSDTLDIIRRSPVPVLVNKHLVEYEREGEKVTRINENIFETPFLAADWSAASMRALELLVSFKKLIRKAAAVHVIEDNLLEGLGEAGVERVKAEARGKLLGYGEIMAGEGICFETHLAAGEPGREIVSVAREFGASMVVMGTTGKGRLRELVVGSVSHEVAETSEMPVLLVPAVRPGPEPS
jgi:nucleotide-binding universal stress UspA family protein